ncbi:unnamed protein product [Amoebophrya sp. A25]|nr:unnamed protein product [Amoebophrya sp. A25]|eukprot:GSA25T00015043001.1
MPSTVVTPVLQGPAAALFWYDPGLQEKSWASKVEGPAANDDIVSFSQLALNVFPKMILSRIEPLLDNQLQAFLAFSAEQVSVMPVQTVGQAPFGAVLGGEQAQCCVKTGYIHQSPSFVIKVASGGAGHGNTGFLLLFSQKTMKLTKMLMDEGILTEIRTAAASCLASGLCLGLPASTGAEGGKKGNGAVGLTSSKNPVVTKIGILGAGVQAVWQLRLLQRMWSSDAGDERNPLMTFPPVLLWCRDREKGQTFINRMRSSDLPGDRAMEIELASTVAEVFSQCQLVHTLTASREPLVREVDLPELAKDASSSRLHITCVGADSPGKQELELGVLERADFLLCDSYDQTFHRGEFQSLFSGRSLPSAEVLSSLRKRSRSLGSMEKDEDRGNNDRGWDADFREQLYPLSSTSRSSYNEKDKTSLVKTPIELGIFASNPKQVQHRLGGPSHFSIFDTSGIAVQDVQIAQLACEMFGVDLS